MELETDVKVSLDIANLNPRKASLFACANKTITLCLKCKKSQKGKAFLTLEVWQKDSLVKTYNNFRQGDTCELKHNFRFSVENHIAVDHLFPVELTYMGQKYFLNKTKQGKLILTK